MSKLVELLQRSTLADLGPGPRPGRLSQPEIEAHLANLGATPKIQEIRALVLLWNDYHDEAHTIVQDAELGDGALIHGILHRREPDYGNAAYRFRRVRSHPVLAEMGAAAQPVLAKNPALRQKLLSNGSWDPFAFIDLCAQATRGKEVSLNELCKNLQWLETQAMAVHLFP